MFAFTDDRGTARTASGIKNGFRADRLSCHRFWPTLSASCCTAWPTRPSRSVSLHLPGRTGGRLRSKLRARLFKIGARVRYRSLHPHPSGHWMALPGTVFPPLHSPSTAAKQPVSSQIFFSLSGVPELCLKSSKSSGPVVSQERILKLAYIAPSQTGSCLPRTKISSLVNNAASGVYCGNFNAREYFTTFNLVGQTVGGFCAKITNLGGHRILVDAWNDWGLASGSRWPQLGKENNRTHPSVEDMLLHGAPFGYPSSTFNNRHHGWGQTVRTRYIWI